MRHASLFSGIGGPEVAATMRGWDNVFHCEINEFAQQVLKYWYPNSVSYGDIKETDFREWEGKIDVLSAGFPCQPFSYAGQRRGENDDRYLWPEMLRVIKEVKPTWVVGENVIGITTMVEQGEVIALGCQGTLFGEDNDISGYYELRERFTIERICEDIECVGYEVQPFVIPACAVGAPHRRDRVFIVARRNDAADTTDNGLQHGAESRSEGSDTGTLQGQRNRAERNIPTSTNGDRGEIADTDSKRLERNGGEKLQGHQKRQHSNEYFASNGKIGILGERWANFPTVSPVHRGNDGFPFNVADLTIPFSQWRTESLKAYGNAIVPQVIYEIFRAIEIVEQI